MSSIEDFNEYFSGVDGEFGQIPYASSERKIRPGQITTRDQLVAGKKIELVHEGQAGQIPTAEKAYTHLTDMALNEDGEPVPAPGFIVVLKEEKRKGDLRHYSISLADYGVTPYETEHGKLWNHTNYIRHHSERRFRRLYLAHTIGSYASRN